MKFGVQISQRVTDLATIADWIVNVGEPAGLDSAWTSESFGWECFTPLAYMAARTHRIRLATGIAAIPARTPAAAAMSAITLDHLSNGRVVLSFGVSGPRVAEGWFGEPFGKPLKKTREYIEIVRKVLNGEPLTFRGEYYQIPIDEEHSEGLRGSLTPLRRDMPIYIGAQGPKNTSLAGEIADGMITGWFGPDASDWYRDRLNEGFRAAGLAGPKPGFEIGAIVDVRIGKTVHEAAEHQRHHIAFHIAKMGLPGRNFYYDTFVRLGYQDICERVVELANAEGVRAAARLVPDEMVEKQSLIGPLDKICEDIKHWDKSCLDLMILRGPDADVIDVLNACLPNGGG